MIRPGIWSLPAEDAQLPGVTTVVRPGLRPYPAARVSAAFLTSPSANGILLALDTTGSMPALNRDSSIRQTRVLAGTEIPHFPLVAVATRAHHIYSRPSPASQ